MKEARFTVEINASRERVWATLWEDRTFRDWAGVIDEGTYLKGDLKEGGEVQFLSAESGYGVTSRVERLDPDARRPGSREDAGGRGGTVIEDPWFVHWATEGHA